ncbi:hypothetical protein KDN32_17735 [Nocardioides sp. J2M5]|uniref:hypothetical protein n=1 Tax=Nocardioides palaemonis TaxID=2829810 RepID=UPI001BA725DD|nr:hypothetical protein [Nocardioides palaemonis]MBS2939584.1 hypothetical protein [Nocardioides palaemonis]
MARRKVKSDAELAGAEIEQPKTDAELAETADKEPDPPVYDERGNVRPRGTEGARPMSYAERVEIARRIAAGEDLDPQPKRPRTSRKS